MTETIREKVKNRLDELEANLKAGKHLLECASEDEMLEVYKLTESVRAPRKIAVTTLPS